MLPNKQKTLLSIVIFLLLLSIMGCAQTNRATQTTGNIKIVKLFGKTLKSVSVSMVGKNLLDVKPPHITYYQQDSSELEIFVNVIQRAEKLPGIADVSSPDYVFTLTFDDKTKSTYSLWLRKNAGSLMNQNDSNTIYKLPSNLIGKLNKVVLTGISDGLNTK